LPWMRAGRCLPAELPKHQLRVLRDGRRNSGGQRWGFEFELHRGLHV
jgi:hypothetical protein